MSETLISDVEQWGISEVDRLTLFRAIDFEQGLGSSTYLQSPWNNFSCELTSEIIVIRQKAGLDSLNAINKPPGERNSTRSINGLMENKIKRKEGIRA